MKIIVPNYTFDKTNGQITFTDYASITLERVLAVINQTSQVIIFQPNNTGKGATASTNVLDLEYDTSAMANTDKLTIVYDDITQDYWKKEDAAHASADSGVPAWAVRKDTAAATAADGDYHPLEVDSTGRLWVRIGSGTAAADIAKAEDDAASSGDVGVPSLFVRRDTPAANAADGDYVHGTTDDLGRLRVVVGKLTTATTVSAGLTTASTAYTAGDMLGTEWTFADVAAVAGGGWEIVSATLLSDVNILGPTDLFLFNASVTHAADNAANSWSDGDAAKCVGVISFPTPGTSALNSIATIPNLSLFGQCDADDNLYGGLVTRIGHTFFTATDDLHIRLVVRRA